MAKRQETRVRRGIPREMVVPRRMDTGIQRQIRRQAVGDDQCQVRRDLGERASGRLRIRDIRRRRYSTVFICYVLSIDPSSLPALGLSQCRATVRTGKNRIK